jgi:hypothetical protein
MLKAFNGFFNKLGFFFLLAAFSVFAVSCGSDGGGGGGSGGGDVINAALPNITAHPQGASYTQGAAAAALSVMATSPDGGIISYQWYRNTVNSNSGGALISGETNTTYTPPTTTVGTEYYYTMVTNTNNSVNGNTTANAATNAAAIIVTPAGVTNAALPNITAHPQGATYNQGIVATALSAAATSPDGGIISYQWYSNTSNSNGGGTLISGETSSTYTPPTTTAGTVYYYAAVTNTNTSVNGNTTASLASNTAAIIVTPAGVTNAALPNITAHPQGATYNQGAAAALSVNATSPDGGNISYQWYSNTSSSNSGGTLISGETSSTYTPPTTTAGTIYYYAVVINTNTSVNGNTTANLATNTAEVTISTVTNTALPNITVHPQSASYTQGAAAAALSVSATSPDGGIISYQWYSNTVSSNSDGTLISGAMNTTYTPPTTTVGTVYYYAVVINTNSSVNGNTTASLASNTAAIIVTPAGVTNAALPNITVHPQGANYNQGAMAAALSVSATLPDGGIISYQWYSNTVSSNSDGTLISGATNTTYTPPTTTVGTVYYYAAVTNTNNSVNGNTTANLATYAAAIIVTPAGVTNAALPNITAHPQGATYNQGAVATALSVTATSPDGGNISYQWYSNTSNSNSGGTLISGETSSTYTPPTTTVETVYYYAVVTNTNNGVNGNTASLSTNAALVTINTVVNAALPNITAHPQGATYNQGAAAAALSVAATSPDNGIISCQWYSNTVSSNSGGTLISGETSSTYTPPTTTAGTVYYYAVVTNTNINVNGNTAANLSTNAAEITVNTIVNAALPNITAHPQGATYNQGAAAAALSVTANSTDGGNISYQWYSNTSNANSGGTLISGETSSTYTPPTTTAETVYYYAVVTNTNTNVNGNTTANLSTNAAEVTINAAYTVVYYDENGQKYTDIGEEGLTYGSVINLPLKEKENTDYTFEGWLKDHAGEPIKGTYTVTEDVSFYATWMLTGATPITSAQELYPIRNDLSGKYILLNDITLAAYDSDEGWEPIGTEATPFTGILDGNGFKITELYVDREVAGLFGYIGGGAEVKNLTVEVSASGVNGKSYAGGLAGSINGALQQKAVISNVHVGGTGVVQADNSSSAQVTVAAYSGGISGYLGNAILSDCSNIIDIISSSSSSSSSRSFSGGIAAYLGNTNAISNSYNTGNVTSFSSYPDNSGGFSGGIAGYITSADTITNSYNTGNITTVTYFSSYFSYSGGIVAYVNNATISKNYSLGTVSGKRIGGIVGYIINGTVTNNAAINTELNGSNIGRIGTLNPSPTILTVTNNFALDSMAATGGSFTLDSASHGIDKTKDELKTAATYSDAVNGNGLGGLGWEFGNDAAHPWKMPEGGGYPVLYWQE